MLFVMIIILLLVMIGHPAVSHYDYYNDGQPPHQELNEPQMNTSFTCEYCHDPFANQPPPDDILFMPPPPLSPELQLLLMPQRDMVKESEITKQTVDSECNYCHMFGADDEQAINFDSKHYSKTVFIIGLTIILAILTIVYFVRTGKGKIVASNIRATIFRSGTSSSSNKSSSSQDSDHSSRPTDPCLTNTNREKNLTSPIITDVPHKKTSIPSNYWAQPNSVIGNTISRMPNDYEVPSSRTNSTCTSSAVYADLTNEGHVSAQARIFSPYTHTYAEVLEPSGDHIPPAAGMIPTESNYDNAVYSHGNLMVRHHLYNGSVQLSDFNSIRPAQAPLFNSSINQTNGPNQMHKPPVNIKAMQQPHRAQIIVSSQHQGFGPSLLQFKERHHDVI